MAKKAGGGVVGAAVLFGLAMLAAVPKEAWIGIVVIAVVGVILYFVFSGKNSPAPDHSTPSQEPYLAPTPRTLPRAAPYPDAALPPSVSIAHAEVSDEPVTVWQAQEATQSFKVPEAPKRKSSGEWIAAGQAITVAGTPIDGGMLYFGSALSSPSGGTDPALINPKLIVSKSGDYRERSFGYWPSYSEISPSARRAYLNWLADGRKDPTADIGYVFLYFYGLERRAILDATRERLAHADFPLIARELRRLLAIYGNHSFHGYASKLLSWLSLATSSNKLYVEPLPEYEKSWEIPLHLRLVLGQCALDQIPLPSPIALSWARLDPNSHLRTPAVRCAAQFEQLFNQKYAESFGQGIVLPVNKTKMKVVYTPASAGFRGGKDIHLNFGDVPDMTVLTVPLKRLREVVEAATKDLENFSRYVGRNPTEASSFDALLLLPAALWPDSVQSQMRELQDHARLGMVVLTLQQLLSKFNAAGPITKDKLITLAQALESMSMAIEPDILAGAKPPKLEDTIVLFTVHPSEKVSRDTPAYQAALLTLQLANAVALADGKMGVEETDQLQAQVEGWNHLTLAHRQRLLAHIRLLAEAPVSLTALKKKLEPLAQAAKEGIAKFMAVIAQADGTVSPAEIKMLEKVYKVLGVDQKNVFSDLHAAAAGGPTNAAGVVVVGSATEKSSPTSNGFKLDMDRIAALQKDTEQVSALLANIFKDEELPAFVSASVTSDEVEKFESTAPVGLVGLDEAHTTLVRMLLSRPSWSREELLDVASDLELMLDGALERINEISFDVHDLAFTEGDDPITVNQEVLEKVPA